MDILQRVKTAKRIGHSKLDEEINDLIEACKLDLDRLGIKKSLIENPDAQIRQAIVLYCLSNLSDDINFNKAYGESYQYQVDSLRKTRKYTEDV